MIFYLCRFSRLRAIVVLGLENPEELNLNDFSANIVVFKNCDFSNLDETNIIGKNNEIMIITKNNLYAKKGRKIKTKLIEDNVMIYQE